MKARIKESWPLVVAVAFALFVALSGFEIQMAYPGGSLHPDKPPGGWTKENMPQVAPGNDKAMISPTWERHGDYIQPANIESQQEQIDRMQFELDTIKSRLQEIPALKLRIMDLELRQREFEQAFGHLLGGS